MKPSFTAIIIDDEPHAIGLLSELLKELYRNITVIGAFTTWEDGLQGLRINQPDILFLDISIGGKNGMDLLKIIPNLESEIIIITAYSEFALDAFRFSATGYIVKPIGNVELTLAVDKAIKRAESKKALEQSPKGHAPLNSKIGIPNDKGISYLDTHDILYLEAINNYTKIVTKQGELTSSYNIGKYKPLLAGQSFYNVHRSYIINLDFVVRYEASGIVVMSNKKEIPVSKNVKEDFLKLFTSP